MPVCHFFLPLPPLVTSFSFLHPPPPNFTWSLKKKAALLCPVSATLWAWVCAHLVGCRKPASGHTMSQKDQKKKKDSAFPGAINCQQYLSWHGSQEILSPPHRNLNRHVPVWDDSYCKLMSAMTMTFPENSIYQSSQSSGLCIFPSSSSPVSPQLLWRSS